jgi:hypothetical protein
MVSCANHPDHQAIEHCEVCERPLCGLCLWYSDDGRRLCEEHAAEAHSAGKSVLPPETYAEAIAGSLVRQTENNDTPGAGEPRLYRGNSQDVAALIAVVAALTTLSSCMGGVYCLPLILLVIGVVLYSGAQTAVDPRRTRIFAGVSIGVGGLFVLFIFSYIAFVAVVLAVSFGLGASGGSLP